tara:strand:+ start:186 stop:1166 length:981 start_codon:yes stop_codon:yes gene_type:complete
MDTLLKTAVKDNVKPSSYKNYRATTIKLFNLSNPKKQFLEEMSDNDLLKGLGNIINNFEKLKEYLDNNDFSSATKKNYINNILNIICKIENIEGHFRYKKLSVKIIEDIKSYWLSLRAVVETKSKEKKHKKQLMEKELEYEKFEPIKYLVDIPELDGLYEINKYGSVRSIKSQKILKPNLNNSNKSAKLTLITNEKKKKTVYIDVLMVNTFLDEVEVKNGKDILLHIDKNLENNHIDNLKFVKHTEENIELYNSYNSIKIPLVKEKRLPKKEILEEETIGKFPCILKIDDTDIHLGYCDTEEEVKLMLQKKTEELIKLISPVPDFM